MPSEVNTTEIEKAIKKLSEGTLKDVLKQFGSEASGSKDELLKKYQSNVVKVGLKNFLGKLSKEDIESTRKALKVKTDENDKKLVEAIEEHLTDEIPSLLDNSSDELLTSFCKTLNLDPSERANMVKHISDELLLTGMESFLKRLPLNILKAHANEMNLTSSGNKSQVVERLMVHIFELEPLVEETESGDKKKGKGKSNAKETKEKKTKETKEKKTKESKEEKTEKESKEEKKKTTKRKEAPSSPKSKSPSKPKSPAKSKSPKKAKEEEKKEESESGEEAEEKPKVGREKFVAPPLTMIAKGKFETKEDLFNNYNKSDLEEYCRKNSLPVSGKKPEIIKRILNHLNGVEAPAKKTGKRKGSGKQPNSKKQKTSTTSSPSSTKTKPSKANGKEKKEA